MWNRYFKHIYRSPGEGGGGGGENIDYARIQQGAEAFIKKWGDNMLGAVTTLMSENYQDREQNRKLKEQIATLEGKQPKEGEVVLSKEDAAIWAAIKEATGDKVGDTVKNLKELNDLKAEKVTTERNDKIEKVAKAHGLNPKVLTQLMKDSEVRFQEVLVEKEGKKETVLAAYIKGSDGVERGLEDHAKLAWSDFAGSLKASEGGATPPAEGGSGGGFSFVGSGGASGGSGGGAGSVNSQLEGLLKSQNENAKGGGNPFSPPAASKT